MPSTYPNEPDSSERHRQTDSTRMPNLLALGSGLTQAQTEFLDSTAPQTAFVAGRGAGKTHAGARWAIAMLVAHPDSLGLITANSYQQLHQSTLPPLFRMLDDFDVPYVWNVRPGFPSRFRDHRNVLSIDLGILGSGDTEQREKPRGAQVVAKSLNNYDFVRGQEYGWWWGDETRDTRREAFDVTLAALRDRRGPCQVKLTTTPNGYDWLYRVFVEEPLANPDLAADRVLIHASTLDNAHHLAPGFADRLRAIYDPLLVRQEVYGEFVPFAQARSAYPTFLREKHIDATIAVDPHTPLILACDFNVSPMALVVGQTRYEHARVPATAGDMTRSECVDVVIGEVVRQRPNPGMSAVESAAREFLDRFGEHAAPVIVVGDQSGHNRDAATTATDYTVLLDVLRQRLGDLVLLHPALARRGKHSAYGSANPLVVDRVAVVNARLHSADDRIRLRIAPGARELIRDLESVTWRESGRNRELDKSDHARTHASDALGYWLWAEHGRTHTRLPRSSALGPQRPWTIATTHDEPIEHHPHDMNDRRPR